MSKPSIQNITTTQTFQNWLDKTNEMVDIFRDSAITASALMELAQYAKGEEKENWPLIFMTYGARFKLQNQKWPRIVIIKEASFMIIGRKEEIKTLSKQKGEEIKKLSELKKHYEEGKIADLVFIDLNKPRTTPIYDVHSSLVYAAHSGQIQSVMINGEFVMKDKQMLTLDEEKIKAEAQELANKIKKEI